MPAAQSRTVIEPLRWPLVNKLQARNSNLPLTKDARLVNCFAEFDGQDAAYWIYKRLGLSTTPVYSTGTTPPNYTLGLGLYTHPFTGQTFAAAQQAGLSRNAALYHIGAVSSFVSMTMPLNVPTPVWYESINSSPQTLVVSTGAQAWVVNPNSVTAVQITAAAYPAVTVPGWAYLDGTLYTMDPNGSIWGSNINDATSWNALNVIQASSNADGGVALAKQLSYVVAFKQYTTQIFYDAGNATGSPLSLVPDAQIALGCLVGNSVAQIDNVLMWVTSNQTISPQIVRMDNLTPKIVSTPAIERVLDNMITGGGTLAGVFIPWSQVWALTLKHGGHRFYILGLSNAANNVTLVYDLDQDLWYVWTDASGNWWPITGLCYTLPISSAGVHYAQHAFNGNIYQLDGDYAFPNDYGNVFPVDIYTPNFEAGTKRRKQLNMMYFGADQTDGSTLRSRYTDDDYQSWSNFRSVDLSEVRPRLPNHGTFTRRAYHFRHQCNTTFRLRSVDLQLDMGTL